MDADRITKRQGTDRHADSAGCSQQGQLLRSGQRLLETAALAGGMVVFRVGRVNLAARRLAELDGGGQGMMKDR